MEWTATFGEQHQVEDHAVQWGDFTEQPSSANDPAQVFAQSFGTIAPWIGQLPADEPLQLRELSIKPLDGVYPIGKLVPWAAPPAESGKKAGQRVIRFFRDLSEGELVCMWFPSYEGVSLDQLYLKHSRVEPYDRILVSTADEFVPWHTLVSSFPEGETVLLVCGRLRYIQRRFASLNDNVAMAYRTMNHSALDKALGAAWTLYLDGASRCSLPDELHNVCLYAEVTRLIGPRFFHCSLMDRGDVSGVSIYRQPSLPGIAQLHNLLLICTTDLTPFLHCPARLTSLSDCNQETGSFVYLEQRPPLSRSLFDVLCSSDASGLRRRFDPANFSLWCLFSMLANHASFSPTSVSLVLQDNGACTLHVPPVVAETAFCANETYSNAQNVEVPLLVNILWLMQDEMSKCVPVAVRERFLSLDAEGVILDVLEAASQCNDRLCEVFALDQLQLTASYFIPILVRSGLGSSLLNKMMLMQRLFRERPSVTHWEVLEALLPSIASVYEAALLKGRNVLDAFRLLAKETHSWDVEGATQWKLPFTARSTAICGDELHLRVKQVTRSVLRASIEREKDAVKLIASVLKDAPPE